MELAADFESQLQDALMDSIEHEFVGQRNGLVHQTIQRSHDILREYGQRHGYDVEPVIDSLGQVDVERTDNRLTVRWGWAHPAAPHFQMGTSDHHIDGDPVLSFIWENPPAWVREEFDQGRDTQGQFVSGWRVFFSSVDVEGLPESRFVREALAWLRREVAT